MGPASPLEKAPSLASQGSWEEQRVQLGDKELLAFGSDPFTITWYRCQGKAVLVCRGERMPHTQPFVGHNLRLPLIAPNGIHKRQNCTKPNDLSGTVRGTVAEGSANEPRAPLLHGHGPRSPRHWLLIKSKKKIHLSQPHSFGHYHYKANRNKVIHKLWAVCSILSPLPPEVGGAGPQELLLELMGVSFVFSTKARMTEKQWECLLPHGGRWTGWKWRLFTGRWRGCGRRVCRAGCSPLTLHAHTACDSCRQHSF